MAYHFASDNAAGIHPCVLEEIAKANQEHAIAYGNDQYTAEAVDAFKKQFGENIDVFFTLTGTAANVIALQSIMQSFHAVICGEQSHLYIDECGAPEKFLSAKLIPTKTKDGKLTVTEIQNKLKDTNMVHRVQPKVVSIAQCTEWGTVYTLEEIDSIANFCHDNDMYLHVDGARLANAACFLNVSFQEMTQGVGVDVVSFGGTKNGLLGAEAIVFFNKHLAENTNFYCKQAMQLTSKMRFIAAQLKALLDNNLWHENAMHANSMAKLLHNTIKDNQELKIVAPVQANAVFAKIPRQWLKPLQQEYLFNVWDSHECIVRWMTAFDTQESDVLRLAELINKLKSAE